jgi:hypothetical protein
MLVLVDASKTNQQTNDSKENIDQADLMFPEVLPSS